MSTPKTGKSGSPLGCILALVVVALVIGAGLWGLDAARKREAAALAGINPYLDLIRAGNYEEARLKHTTAAWQSRHQAQDLRATYETMRQKHGSLGTYKVYLANGFKELTNGRAGMRMSGRLHFGDKGYFTMVTFELVQTEEGGPYVIDASRSGQQNPEPGPW